MVKKNNSKDIEKDLRGFPTHQLSEPDKERIHEQLMNNMDNNEQKKRRLFDMKRLVAGVTSVAALLLLVFFVYSPLGNNNATNENAFNNNESGTNTDQATDQNVDNGEDKLMDQDQQRQEQAEFTRATALLVMDRYNQTFNTLIDEAEKDGLLANYNTKKEVVQHFENAMTTEYAEEIVDSYFEERTDGIFLIPTDTLKLFVEEDAFDINQINKENYEIIQERSNELMADIIITFSVTWSDGKWIVSLVESTPTDKSIAIQESAYPILQAIYAQDMSTLAEYVHLEKGLLFSPYVYVEEDALTFSKDEVASLMEDETQYVWGRQDGSGFVIEMTADQYFEEYLLTKDFRSVDEIRMDEFIQRGNSITNIHEVFPQATVLEFYVAPSSEGEMDWGSLNLVFEQDQNGDWKLVALVNDRWTI